MPGIGDTTLTSVNGEIYTPVSQRLMRQYTFQVLGSRLKPGCAEQGIADGLADLIGQYLAQ